MPDNVGDGFDFPLTFVSMKTMCQANMDLMHTFASNAFRVWLPKHSALVCLPFPQSKNPNVSNKWILVSLNYLLSIIRSAYSIKKNLLIKNKIKNIREP